MRYIIAQPNKEIALGRQGENNVTTVQFDVKGWEEEYGEGTFTLAHQRCQDGDGYEREITQDGNTINWVITNVDVAYAGKGVAQLTYTVGGSVAKSEFYFTNVLKSLDSDGTAPDPWIPWVESVLEAGANAVEAAQNAAESEGNAATSESNAEAAASSALNSAREAASYVGSPLVALTAAQMADATRVYVYVGDESGYVSGDWYYYNGTAWTDGGVYNSIAVDVATNADIDSVIYS